MSAIIFPKTRTTRPAQTEAAVVPASSSTVSTATASSGNSSTAASCQDAGGGTGIVSLAVSMEGPRLSQDGSVETFSARKIARGIWSLTPSLNIPGVIHAFVVLYDVPEPAPWEWLIVLVGA